MNAASPPAGEATDAKSPVDEQVAGWNHVDIDAVAIAHPHDGSLPELLLDMRDSEIEIALAGFGDLVDGGFFGKFSGHGRTLTPMFGRTSQKMFG
jgi:hypothetical protein